MRANEFCYWLQGYFEICDAQGLIHAPLKSPAVRCVRAHLALVKESDPNHSNVFVAWLSERLKDDVEVDVSDIRRFLAAQFKHVIDPSYGGNQKKLSAIHDGTGFVIGSTDGNGNVYRC